MQFHGFKKEGIDFLKALKKNNSKEWFEGCRYIWERSILEPNKTYKIDNIFYAQELIDKIFEDYREMKDLQQWVYKMDLYDKVKENYNSRI